MLPLLLGASALLPALLLVTFFQRRDVFPEPGAVLWRTFGLGVLCIIPALLLAWPLDTLAEQLGNPLAYGFASAFLGAAIPEELAKFLVLYFYAARHIEFDEPMDGIVYGATASLGFAALENVLYVAEGGLGVAAVRAVLSVPGHALFGAVMGYFVGQAKFTQGPRNPLLVRALVLPILLHGLYDTPLLATGGLEDAGESVTGCVILLLLPMAPAIVFGGWIWIIRLLRRMRSEQFARGPGPVEAIAVPMAGLVAVPVSGVGPVVVPGAVPGVVPAPPPPSTILQPSSPSAIPGKFMGWLLTLGGGLLACGGVLVSLALVVGVLVAEEGVEDLLATFVGGVILGVLPSILGILAFFSGIRRLNRANGKV